MGDFKAFSGLELVPLEFCPISKLGSPLKFLKYEGSIRHVTAFQILARPPPPLLHASVFLTGNGYTEHTPYGANRITLAPLVSYL